MSEERDALVQAKRAGTPSYSLKVGDSVILGAIESVHVEKVLYDGLCYEVCCTKVDKTTDKRTLEHCIEPWRVQSVASLSFKRKTLLIILTA